MYLQDSNVALAFKHFQEAIKLKPNHVPSLIEIGTILSDVRPEESTQILRYSIHSDIGKL